MNYYLAVFFCFVVGFVLTEIYKANRNKRMVVVKIKRKDGSVTTVMVRTGRDPEVDELIKQARKPVERVV